MTTTTDTTAEPTGELPPPVLDECDAWPAGTPIDVRWNGLLHDLPAIGKDSTSSQLSYKFRSIDTVLDYLNPLLDRHGVHVIPERQKVSARWETPTRSGGVLYRAEVTVRWSIRSVDGETISAQTVGEGSDTGDKATSKAQTMAFKYLLWPALAIRGNDDPDATEPEHGAPRADQETDQGQAERDNGNVGVSKNSKSQAGLLRHIRENIGLSVEAMAQLVKDTVQRDVKSLDELTSIEQSVMLQTLRAMEKEQKQKGGQTRLM